MLETIHIWTIVSLEGWYLHHDSRLQGSCPGWSRRSKSRTTLKSAILLFWRMWISNKPLIRKHTFIWSICTFIVGFTHQLQTLQCPSTGLEVKIQDIVRFSFLLKNHLFLNIRYYPVWPHTFGFMTQGGARGQNLGHLQSAILIFWIM